MEKNTKVVEVKVTPAGSIGWQDVLKGIVMAVLTPVLVVVQQSIEKGELTFNWKVIALSAIGGGVAYLLKNFFTSSVKEVKP